MSYVVLYSALFHPKLCLNRYFLIFSKVSEDLLTFMYGNINLLEEICVQEWDGYENVQLHFLLVVASWLPVIHCVCKVTC